MGTKPTEDDDADLALFVGFNAWVQQRIYPDAMPHELLEHMFAQFKDENLIMMRTTQGPKVPGKPTDPSDPVNHWPDKL